VAIVDPSSAATVGGAQFFPAIVPQERDRLRKIARAETLFCDSGALGPDVIENESGDEESEKNSNDTIADIIEIGIGRVTGFLYSFDG
jgi:hypothetical protein